MASGKTMPELRCFRKVINGGSVVLGFLRDGVVYFYEGLAVGGSSVELRQTVLEEVGDYLSGSKTALGTCKTGHSSWRCGWRWRGRTPGGPRGTRLAPHETPVGPRRNRSGRRGRLGLGFGQRRSRLVLATAVTVLIEVRKLCRLIRQREPFSSRFLLHFCASATTCGY